MYKEWWLEYHYLVELIEMWIFDQEQGIDRPLQLPQKVIILKRKMIGLWRNLLNIVLTRWLTSAVYEWVDIFACVFCVATSLSMRKYRPIWGWGVPHWMKGPSRDITVSKRMRGYYRSIDNNRDMTLGWNVGPEGEKYGCCHNWGRACLWAGLVLQ